LLKLLQEYGPKTNRQEGQLHCIEEGMEPLGFVIHFHGWDDSKAKIKPEEAITIDIVKDKLVAYTRTYTLNELLAKPPEIDQGVIEVLFLNY
jgi:hypothetical protein